MRWRGWWPSSVASRGRDCYGSYVGDGDAGRYPIEEFYDEDLAWREEAFGERPVLGPWGDPFHDEEPLECGLEEPEVCESCQ